MNLILLGAPGAGKGTQAELLTEKLGIPAISTGNMLREAMRNETETGRKVKHYMDNGLLVPDDVILAIVRDRVSCPDCAGGFILDGVPRTIAQAQGLEALGVRIDHVISIEIEDAVIETRMSGRRVCSACGASYHIAANPPKTEGTCDLCGDGPPGRHTGDGTPPPGRVSPADRGAQGLLSEAWQAPACGGESAHRGREPRDSRGDRCVT